MTDNAQKTPPQQILEIQRIYTKDISLETPNTPQIFRENLQPEVGVDLDVANSILESNAHEVVLSVTVTAKLKDKVIFLVEVKQAGIFQIAGFEKEQLDQLLGAYCPNILFPYARETVSDLIARASFPQLNLAPINFEAIYAQKKEAESGEGSTTKH